MILLIPVTTTVLLLLELPVIESGNGDEEAQNKNFNTNDAFTGITIDNVDSNETNATIISDQGTIDISNLPPYYALCFIIKTTATSGSGSGGAGGGAGFVDKIEEGDTKAEVIDTESESKFTVEIDATEKFSVDIAGPKIHRQDNSLEGGSIVFNRAADDVAAFELDVLDHQVLIRVHLELDQMVLLV